MTQKNKQRKAWIWGPCLDDFIANIGPVGGLTIQMYFWAKLLSGNHYKVYSLAGNRKNHLRNIQGINFVYMPSLRFMSPLVELWRIIKICLLDRPDIIITRGATRCLFMLSLCSRLTGIKQISFFASDSDLVPGAELISRQWDRKLWQLGLKINRFFVCQNQKQYDLLQKNYCKSPEQAVIIPNIWLAETKNNNSVRKNILWISNFRKLKHPEVFLELARRFPDEHFIMAGAPFDRELYRQTEEQASKLDNIELLGQVSFDHANKLFEEAKLFVCTSDTEGFPNTFLQSFSNGIPVLTTFDPSDIVKNHRLGMVADSPGVLTDLLAKFLNDRNLQSELSANAAKYFADNYSPRLAISKIEYLTTHYS